MSNMTSGVAWCFAIFSSIANFLGMQDYAIWSMLLAIFFMLDNIEVKQ